MSSGDGLVGCRWSPCHSWRGGGGGRARGHDAHDRDRGRECCGGNADDYLESALVLVLVLARRTEEYRGAKGAHQSRGTARGRGVRIVA
jgi:hypothetical protein